MNRRWTITLLLLPVVVLSVLLLTRSLHTVPPDKCSDVYRQYKDTPGIKASFIKDYPINDTLNVDVVLLVADTDAGWDTLHRDFNLTKVTPIVQQMIDQGRLRVLSRLSPRENPSLPIDKTNPDNNIVLSENLAEHVMALFYTRNNAENTAVLEYNYCNPNKKIVL